MTTPAASPVSLTPVSLTPVSLTPVSSTPVSSTPVSLTPGTPFPAERLRELRERMARIEGRTSVGDGEATGVRTGCGAFDRLWPGGGVARGSLVEWFEREEGAGAETLIGFVARAACDAGRQWLVVLDREREFYPPALAAWGCDLGRVVVVRAERAEDELWAVDQALRCRAVGAVWWRCDRLHERDFRRLQLAAESGGVIGLLRRPAQVAGQPTWADVQWRVEPVSGSQGAGSQGAGSQGAGSQGAGSQGAGSQGAGSQGAGRRWRVTVIRCRGGVAGRSVEIEMDERSGTLRALDSLRETPAAGATRRTVRGG